MISCLYNEFVDIERLSPVLDELGDPTNKKEFVEYLEDVKCYIQAFDDDMTRDISNGFGKDWRVWCDVADIQEGDRLIRTPNTTPVEYRIVGIKTFNGIEQNHHLELRIRAFKS